MTSITLQFHSKVVYVALARMTKDRATIQSAFTYWYSELSGDEFDIPKIVTALDKFVGMSGAEKKTLHVAMQAATHRTEDELPAVPQSLMTKPRSSAPEEEIEDAPVSTHSAHYEITVAVLQGMAQQMNKSYKDDFDEMKSALLEEAASYAESKVAAGALEAWATQGLGMLSLPKDISEEHCSHMVHAFSMLASEFIGPVNLDTVSNLAIRDSLDLPAASLFDPRQLL